MPKGNYSLYVQVQDPEAWQLIVNKQTGQWGLSYSASQDLGRVKMTMAKPAVVERLNYALTDHGSGKGELSIAWEHHIGRVPIAVRSIASGFSRTYSVRLKADATEEKQAR